MIDRILQDRYKITDHIGCGGMAEVYKASDLLLERVVAVKILQAQFASDENFVKKFRREARSAGRMTDSNIVSIFDVGQEGDLYYIVMEYVEGETLKKTIARAAPLEAGQAVFLARGVANALCKAHAQGIVHCDIKPHNILIDETGNPKVSDFGIAHAVSSATITFDGAIVGTVQYLSPEQAKGEPVTFSSDIYSLGVVLFEMLTGQLPFSGDTPIAVALQHVQAYPPLLREINPDLPAVLEAIVSKAMAKQPEDRYENAEMFIKALDSAMESLSGNARAQDTVVIKPVEVSQKRSAVNKFPLKYLLFSLLLFAVFAFGSYMVFGHIWFTGEVTVPNVTGKQIEEARALLQENRLKDALLEEHSTTVPEGIVFLQSPEAGSVVKEEREITLTVSRGPELINVPKLVGLSKERALQLIASLSLSAGRIEEREDAGQAAGTVLWQNPAPPAQVGANAYVDIIVSSPKVTKTPMPELFGMTLNQARLKLSALKLKIGGTEDRYTTDRAPGTIIDQMPQAGQDVAEGEDVLLIIARLPGEATKNALVEFVLPRGRNQKITITVADSRGSRIIYSGTHGTGERLRQTVEGTGTVRVQLHSNGRLIEEKTL